MSKSLFSKSEVISRSLSKRVNVTLFDVVKRLNPFMHNKKDKVRPDVNRSDPNHKITINLDEEGKEEDENAVPS